MRFARTRHQTTIKIAESRKEQNVSFLMPVRSKSDHDLGMPLGAEFSAFVHEQKALMIYVFVAFIVCINQPALLEVRYTTPSFRNLI